ncbi:MAG TPA: helix-turn-helix domain-containing protein [Terriglobales bacterium]|nr:helix-turn-helix domain-containing protein [Terriglobales bacterium]
MPKSAQSVVVPDAGLLTVPEAAAFLRIKPSTVRAWVLYRRIPFLKLGGSTLRFRRSDLEKFISESVIEAAA